MVQNNKIKPLSDTFDTISNASPQSNIHARLRTNSAISPTKLVTDLDSLSTLGLEETSYLKLKPFTRMDPMLIRLLTFLKCFGLFLNFDDAELDNDNRKKWSSKMSTYFKIGLMLLIDYLIQEVAYDVNLRQSKLLAEQKRSTPLLTFVIMAYSWFTIVIPVMSDLCLIFIGSHLFRFYSRTTATVCDGVFFGKRTSVDGWYYYSLIVLIAFLDAVGQVVVLGIWPKSINSYMDLIAQEGVSAWFVVSSNNNGSTMSNNTAAINPDRLTSKLSAKLTHETVNDVRIETNPKIRAHLLDLLLGEKYAHGDLGVCIKTLFLMIQFIHSYALLLIVILLAHHYTTVINNINDNLEKYDFKRLLKQLIILRDSSEQISLLISLPLCIVIVLIFSRQIALNGIFIQSTMLAYENWAVSLQSITSGISMIMLFFYCDGLQSASKQAHRLKTEQTVLNENRGGNQSIYEFLDYLDRLSKSIRITFFNIIAINKGSLVGLFGHILTLTFVTS